MTLSMVLTYLWGLVPLSMMSLGIECIQHYCEYMLNNCHYIFRTFETDDWDSIRKSKTADIRVKPHLDNIPLCMIDTQMYYFSRNNTERYIVHSLMVINWQLNNQIHRCHSWWDESMLDSWYKIQIQQDRLCTEDCKASTTMFSCWHSTRKDN